MPVAKGGKGLVVEVEVEVEIELELETEVKLGTESEAERVVEEEGVDRVVADRVGVDLEGALGRRARRV